MKKYDYDKLGEFKISEAQEAFERKHGYWLQNKEERNKKIKETGVGEDYLYYMHYKEEDGVLVLYYGEHTPHDIPYWISLELPLHDESYPVLESTFVESEENLALAELKNAGTSITELLQILKSESVYWILRYGVKSPSNSGMDNCEDSCYYDLYNIVSKLKS